MLKHFAAARAYVELHDMIAIAQTARRAMERKAAAKQIWPIGEGSAHVLARQSVMRITEPLIVQQHLHAGNAGTRQCPALDGQPSGYRFDRNARMDRRAVDLQTKPL